MTREARVRRERGVREEEKTDLETAVDEGLVEIKNEAFSAYVLGSDGR